MVEQLCPVCGGVIASTGYEKEGVVFCCEPCASGDPCECGCYVVAGGPEAEEQDSGEHGETD